MAHAHHFLERLDRVTREQTEFALGLYRDSEAVRFVLDHVRLPEDAPRVALALEDQREGPFVIVTRDGRFVTCLGRGMRQNHPTVPREQVDALLAKVTEKRARREFAQRELRPDEEQGELFQRIFIRGSRFAREDYLAISAFEAMFGMTPYMLMLEVGLDVVQSREPMVRGAHRVTRITQKVAKALERQDRLTWGTAHLMLLCGAGERRDRDEILGATRPEQGSPTFPCAAHGGLTFLFRGAWVAGRFGKTMIPAYKHGLSAANHWLQAVDAGLGLGAIGLRHAGALAEVHRFLQGLVARADGYPEEAPEALRGRVAKAILETMDAADERAEAGRKIGSDLCVALGGWLPESHALRFTDASQVPDHLARTALLSFDGDIHDNDILKLAVGALPVAARADAEDFYFTRDVVRAWLGEWEPAETLERLKRFSNATPKREPVRAEKTPGRNDPCPCGSGRKWKKCHGGGDVPAGAPRP